MQAWLIWIRKHTFTSLAVAILFMALAPGAVVAQQPPPRPGDPGPRPQSPPPSMTDPEVVTPGPGPIYPGGSSTGPDVQPAMAAGSDVGQIHLATTPGALTVVQWQDGSGNWNDVTSWRAVATSGSIAWTVDPKDFGTGPFRWVVYAADGYRIAGVSGAFTLPGAGQTVSVSASGGYTPPPPNPGGHQSYGSAPAYSPQPPTYQKPAYQPPAYGTGGYLYGGSGYQQPQYGYSYSYGYANAYPYYKNYQAYPYNYGTYGYSGYSQQHTYQYHAYNTNCWCYTQGVWYYVCAR